MKQIAQNYKSGELTVLDVPAPVCRPGGVLVRSLYSLISTGTEMMKVTEASMSMVGMARARPDQVKKVIDQVQQQGLVTTYKKVMNKLDSYTPLGYSLCGVVTEVGKGAEEFKVGQLVACTPSTTGCLSTSARRSPTASRQNTPRSPPWQPSPCTACAGPRFSSARRPPSSASD
jgi:threonine dehydrogenase-like Zn-dependent dehydrogenase